MCVCVYERKSERVSESVRLYIALEDYNKTADAFA